MSSACRQDASSPVASVDPSAQTVSDEKRDRAPRDLHPAQEEAQRLFSHRTKCDQQEVQDGQVGGRQDLATLWVGSPVRLAVRYPLEANEAERFEDVQNKSGFQRWWSGELGF